jgi:hypothetical protein
MHRRKRLATGLLWFFAPRAQAK